MPKEIDRQKTSNQGNSEEPNVLDLKKIRRLMDERLMTQSYMARKLDISPRSMGNKLTGATEFKVSELCKLSKLLRVTIGSLFEQEGR